MTIELGWNIIPILITIASIVTVIVVEREDRGGMLSGLGCMFAALMGGFVTSTAWLIYVLCTR